MTLSTPWGFDGKTYNGESMRQLVDTMFQSPGVVGVASFAVTQQASPGATVQVAAGDIIVAATHAGESGKYLVSNDATLNSPSFTPTTTNGRWDYLILRITSGVAALEIVQGTAAGSPAAPTITGDNFQTLSLVKLPPSTSNITTAMLNDQRATAAVVSGIPPGSLQAYAGVTAPAGWYFANGATKSRTGDAALFAAIGITYGAGDGTTTFNLPDVRGRTLVALDNMGGSDAGVLTAPNTLGGGGGEESHTLTAGESGLRDHAHTINRQAFLVVGGSIGEFAFPTTSTTDSGGATNGVGNFNALSAHNNMPPCMLINYIIKA